MLECIGNLIINLYFMVANNEYKNDSKAYKSMKVSIVMFVLVLLFSIWLYFYNSNIVSKNTSLQTQITSLEDEVKKLNEDEKVKLYTLIVSNKVYLERYKYLSNVPEFINNLREISKNYKVNFEWFSYSDWQISSNASLQDDALSLASVKTKNFLEYFRKKDDNIFSLWFVSSFNWQDNINFWVKFKVK